MAYPCRSAAPISSTPAIEVGDALRGSIVSDSRTVGHPPRSKNAPRTQTSGVDADIVHTITVELGPETFACELKVSTRVGSDSWVSVQEHRLAVDVANGCSIVVGVVQLVDVDALDALASDRNGHVGVGAGA